jgi:hypothetical protein
MSNPVAYEIKIEGTLEQAWSGWFGNLRIEYEQGDRPVTVLTGEVTDQAALHGILDRIRDLNLALVSVTRFASAELEE